MRYTFALIVLAITFMACTPQEKQTAKAESNNDHLLFATLYHQYTPEYKALCLQSYHVAKRNLAWIMESTNFEVAPAVVLDLDETVLDNSPFEAKCILENTSYPKYWDEWMNEANADLVPGAADFLETAQALGAEIYYISNRKEKYLAQTIKNMQLHKLPNADSAHIWLRTDTSSKKARRDSLSTQRTIVLLIGDNLNDFTEAFELDNNNERMAEVEKMKDLFGQRFIMLPNPMYGEWEKAILDGSYEHERTDRDSLYKKALRSF